MPFSKYQTKIQNFPFLPLKLSPKDLLLIQKVYRRMNDSKEKIVNGQFFEKAVNLWLYEIWLTVLQFIIGVRACDFPLEELELEDELELLEEEDEILDFRSFS